MKEALE
jgi:hypothetical protein